MKNFIIKSFFAIFLVGTWANSVMADDGLQFTGTVAASGTACFKHFDRIIKKESNEKLFAFLTVSYQVRNDSNQPIFFLTSHELLRVGIYDLRGASDVIKNGSPIDPLRPFTHSGIRFLSNYELRQNITRDYGKKDFMRSISLPEITKVIPKYFKLIEPGAHYEFLSKYYLSLDSANEINKINEICNEPDPEKRILPTLKDLGFTNGKFKVRFSFSDKDVKDHSTTLSDLQQRLKPYGHLPLTSGGDIAYTSEDIIFAP